MIKNKFQFTTKPFKAEKIRQIIKKHNSTEPEYFRMLSDIGIILDSEDISLYKTIDLMPKIINTCKNNG